MADKNPPVPAMLDVQVLQAGPGNITPLHGNDVTILGAPNHAGSPSGGAAPAGFNSGWPVVMPQPSVIVVTVGQKPDTGAKPEKVHSEVVKRP